MPNTTNFDRREFGKQIMHAHDVWLRRALAGVFILSGIDSQFSDTLKDELAWVKAEVEKNAEDIRADAARREMPHD